MSDSGQSGGARRLPSVDRVLTTPEARRLLSRFNHQAVVGVVRAVLTECRADVLAGAPAPSLEEVARAVETRIDRWRPGPAPVINATGVILHTNIGRAPLSADARDAVARAAGYVDLEYDIRDGGRGSRHAHVETLVCAATGAEAALVTVNNASAVTLVLAALAARKDVLVSRGEAVEIGGGFRVPAILRQSGARLKEVGTTNRTRLPDYAEAMGPRTGAVLHVHTSNFRIVGFTESPALQDLAGIAREAGIPLIVDNGSGALLDTTRFGLAHEPMVQEALVAGADLVTFSGDKLLGGPQAGVVAGRRELVERCRRHSLMRAVRPDKLALAALSATLLAYLRGDAEQTIPVWQMIAEPMDRVRERAEGLCQELRCHGVDAEVVEGDSAVGGGSLPGETLATALVALPSRVRAARLRAGPVPVLGRTMARRVHLDLRTVRVDQEEILLRAILDAADAGILRSSPADNRKMEETRPGG